MKLSWNIFINLRSSPADSTSFFKQQVLQERVEEHNKALGDPPNPKDTEAKDLGGNLTQEVPKENAIEIWRTWL